MSRSIYVCVKYKYELSYEVPNFWRANFSYGMLQNPIHVRYARYFYHIIYYSRRNVCAGSIAAAESSNFR